MLKIIKNKIAIGFASLFAVMSLNVFSFEVEKAFQPTLR